MNTFTRLWIRAVLSLSDVAHGDRGSASDNIIWIAFLTGIALTVTALVGPKILAAANSIRFK